ncbi:MAG: hypothetical protein WD738_00870 [Pirellulales bacterium]
MLDNLVVGTSFDDVLANPAPTLPGDFNLDGTVDAADYVVWRKTDNTQAGYDTWRANFGQTAGSSSALPFAAPLSAAVPEPAPLTLAAVGILGLIACARQPRGAVRRGRLPPRE